MRSKQEWGDIPTPRLLPLTSQQMLLCEVSDWAKDGVSWIVHLSRAFQIGLFCPFFPIYYMLMLYFLFPLLLSVNLILSRIVFKFASLPCSVSLQILWERFHILTFCTEVLDILCLLLIQSWMPVHPQESCRNLPGPPNQVKYSPYLPRWYSTEHTKWPCICSSF